MTHAPGHGGGSRERAARTDPVSPSRTPDENPESKRTDDQSVDRSGGHTRVVAGLHRAHGNQAVQRLVNGRTGRTVSLGDDEGRYEREADRVENEFPWRRPTTPDKDDTDGRPLPEPERVVSALDSGRPHRPLRPQTGRPPVRRSTAGLLGTEGLQSAGRPLNRGVREPMESWFGHDLRDVRVHTGERAAKSARSMGALAYTVGSDVVFGTEQYAPTTPAGRRLIAHELVHVIQQTGAPPALGAPVEHRTGRARVQREQPDAQQEIPETESLEIGRIVVREDETPVSAMVRALVQWGLTEERAREVVDRIGAKWDGTPPETGETVHVVLSWSVVRNLLAERGLDPADVRVGGTDGPPDGPGTLGPSPTGPTLRDEFVPTQPETVEDIDTLLQGNPVWQQMSKEDRTLLIELAKLSPDELETRKLPLGRLTTDHKVTIALKLSTDWAGEVQKTAKAAFSDPAFISMLVATTGVYVGLWLVPDPSAITKVLAGTLTAVLLLQFGYHDIYGTAVAWMDLRDACAKATTVAELKAAGDAFARKMGTVGFDILLMIGTWGLGKAAGPRLAKVGAKKNVAQAEAAVKAAEAQPGSGVPKRAETGAGKLLELAKAGEKQKTPTEILDALSESGRLPESATRGLRSLRERAGDANTLKALEGQAAKGYDISHFLAGRSLSPETARAAKARLLQAEAKLARAKLIEAKTIKDPALRKAAQEAGRAEMASRLQGRLQELGILDSPKVERAIQRGGLNELIGVLGEALQRTALRSRYPASKGFTIESNLVVVREIKGFERIADWQAAEKAAGRLDEASASRAAAKMFEHNGKVWEAIAEADAVITRPGESGKSRIVEVQEAKTGAGDRPASAMEQVNKFVSGLEEVAAGRRTVRIFERPGKNELGRERTGDFDLSDVGSARKSTMGPSGKSFTESLPYDVSVLELLAESLVRKGLPKKAPGTPVPPRREPERE